MQKAIIERKMTNSCENFEKRRSYTWKVQRGALKDL